MNVQRSGQPSRWKALSRAVACIVPALALVTLGCEREPAPGADVTAGQVVENPGAYIGKTVRVSGEVERAAGERSFVLDSGVASGGLLVLGAPPPQESGDEVVVTGTVRTLVIAEVERELGWDLDPEIEMEFESKPVLIAQGAAAPRAAAPAEAEGDTTAEAQPQPEPAAAAPARGDEGALPAGAAAGAAGTAAAGEETAARSGEAPVTDFASIVEAADQTELVGRHVRVENVKIERVVGDRGFWLSSEEEEVFARLAGRWC